MSAGWRYLNSERNSRLFLPFSDCTSDHMKTVGSGTLWRWAVGCPLNHTLVIGIVFSVLPFILMFFFAFSLCKLSLKLEQRCFQSNFIYKAHLKLQDWPKCCIIKKQRCLTSINITKWLTNRTLRSNWWADVRELEGTCDVRRLRYF